MGLIELQYLQMTKEEYKDLLNSDYWKGYSYSLIKERNFTCEDCGRTFYNERNKLQVHHLLYRDVNPWSYKPEELVVLCEECHKKRHGIEDDTIKETDANESSKYQSDSENTRSQEEDYTDKKKNYYYPNRNKYSYRTNSKNRSFSYSYRKRNQNKIIRYLIGAIVVSVLILGILQHTNKQNTVEEDKQENTIKNESKNKKARKKRGHKKKGKNTEDKSEVANIENDDFVEIEQAETDEKPKDINTQETTIEEKETDKSE